MVAIGKFFGTWISVYATLLLGLGGCASEAQPTAQDIVAAKAKLAAIVGNTLKQTEVSNLKCNKSGNAWGCSYDLRGIEVLRNGREVSFDHKRQTMKLEKRGDAWEQLLL